MLIPPKYFSDQNNPLPEWEEKHQEEFLELLNNDLTRNDFIQLLEAVDSNTVTPEKSKEIYSSMRKVGLIKKETSEKAMDNMLEKYKAYAETFHELENI